MPVPKGSLTAAQYEIMAAVWNAGDAGVTVAEIWQAIAESRTIGRTTVLNQVDRLEKRGWLRRLPGEGRRGFTPRFPRKMPRASWWPGLFRIISTVRAPIWSRHSWAATRGP